jgi:hypothetical protein
MRTPSTSTVQAPHAPWSQPFFVPVSSRYSRSASKRLTCGSTSRTRADPLIRSVISGTTSLSSGHATVDPARAECNGCEMRLVAASTAYR